MSRPVRTAEILAVGTELTTGGIRDSNSGDLASDLTARGVDVRRMTALPDRLDDVRAAFEGALERVDLVVSTGGLGPTPDDLTREAIAAAMDEVPEVDPTLEAWLREMFDRRGLQMPDANLKQAWLIPSAEALPNQNGTAPGWWVEATSGGVIVALPGPPREALPIWRDEAIPRLAARGLGDDRATRTLRVTGVGESALADLIGEGLLRAENPQIATYVRPDAVDVRFSAVATDGRPASEIVDDAVTEVWPRIGEHVFAEGEETWLDALAGRLEGRDVAVVEIGTGGQVGALIAGAEWCVFAESVAPRSEMARAHADLRAFASRVREVAGTRIGLAVRARERAADTAVAIAIDLDGDLSQVSRTAFQRGETGRRRAALVACAELWRRLGEGA